MKNEEYWSRRAAQRMFEHMQSAEDTADQIAALYLKASRYLSAQIEGIFERYKTKHGLSDAETRRLLNTLQDKTDIQELLRQLRNGDSDKSKQELIQLLESPAYRSRIERLQQLQSQLDLIMQQVYQQEKTFSTAHYIKFASEAYYRSMFDIQQRVGFGFSFAHIDQKQIDRVVGSKWSGKNYSSRIWSNTKALAQDLKEELLTNLVTGRTEFEASQILAEKFAQGASVARRLVRTESSFLSGQMEMKSYEEAGIDRYRYLATLDLRTSELCRSLDGKVFPVSEQQPGKNCPPMHPWCRSTTIAVITDEDLQHMERRARDPMTGKTIMVPATMTYPEWYKEYVEGKTEAEAEQKKIKNYAADKKQHEQYRQILGDEIPESFAKFQEMKYNEPERWNEMKEAYRDVNWQRKALDNHFFGEKHSSPFEGQPNSVYDNYREGKLLQRRFYGNTGKPRLDIDMTDHGNPKDHPVVPHYHGWRELLNGKIEREGKHDNALKLGHRIANADILKGEKENVD